MKKENEIVPNKEMTRGTKALIKEAVRTTQSSNRFELLQYVTDQLVDKFPGETLDYQLARMKLGTTNQILEAIDTYAYRHSKSEEEKKMIIDN